MERRGREGKEKEKEKKVGVVKFLGQPSSKA